MKAALVVYKGPTKGFLALSTYDKKLTIDKRGYLIRLGHTEARLKKSDIKKPKFTPCRN